MPKGRKCIRNQHSDDLPRKWFGARVGMKGEGLRVLGQGEEGRKGNGREDESGRVVWG